MVEGGIKMEKGIITKKEFNKLPKGKGENAMLKFFKENSDKAFTGAYLIKNLKWSKASIFRLLRNLETSGLIEKKEEYYSLK